MKTCKTEPAKTGSQKLRPPSRDFLAKGATKPRIPTRWQWHCKTLLTVREHLLGDRREQFGDIATQLEPHSMSLADSATDEFDRDVTLAELSVRQNALFEIDEALSRIVNGTYGVCEETGAPIPEARLRAIPWTRFCREVEDRLERKGMIPVPSLGLLHSLRETEDGDVSQTQTRAISKSRGDQRSKDNKKRA